VFSVKTAEALFQAFPKQLIGIISRPDRIRGRDRDVSPSPMKAFAQSQNIPVFTPESKDELASVVQQLNPDLVVVVAFGMIIPKSVTDSYFCINSHASLLPSYRGASPIQASLLNGDSETGITLIRMNEGMDTGDMLHHVKTSITDKDNLGTLSERLATLAAETLVFYIQNRVLKNRVQYFPQDEAVASYCKKIEKDELQLMHSQSNEEKWHRIRAFGPKPAAFVRSNGKRIKILEAKLEQGELIPILIQPEGKALMSYTDYLLGSPQGISWEKI